jgi:hypothetical protein
MTRITLICVVGLLVLSAMAASATQVYEGYVTFPDVGSNSLTLPQWNELLYLVGPGHYTLLGITVEVLDTAQGGFAADNDSLTATDASASLTRTWTTTMPGVGNVNDAYTWLSTPVHLDPDNGDDGGMPDFTGPDGVNWGTVGYADHLASTTNVGSGYWALYSGTGTINFGINATSMTNVVIYNPSILQQQQQTTGADPNLGVRVRITYNDAPVPEPGSMALLSVGLLGLVGMGLRRRKQS